jgi:hypothetical protein
MAALLIFHLRAGVRIALRSFAPVFSVILALIMLNVDPAGAVIGIASAIFAQRPALAAVLPTVALAFLFPAWAAPKLSHGLHGWIRHLAFTSRCNRRGLALALITAQMPLGIALLCLAFVAHTRGLSLGGPALRWLLVLISGSVAALPVRRRLMTGAMSVVAALLALLGNWGQLLCAVLVLLAAEAVSGPLRHFHRYSSWRDTDSLLGFRIAWRALGWRTGATTTIALLPLAATALFITNNDLPPLIEAGAARLGGCMAVAVLLAGLADKIALRRPPWPLARSFPWSAAQRVTSDALFLSLHALLPVYILFVRHPASGICVLGLMPLLALRAATYIRRIPQLRVGAVHFLAEGSALAALLSLLPWVGLLCLAATPLAFVAARNSERSLKVTCWTDRHHEAIGDPLSWSES